MNYYVVTLSQRDKSNDIVATDGILKKDKCPFYC